MSNLCRVGHSQTAFVCRCLASKSRDELATAADTTQLSPTRSNSPRQHQSIVASRSPSPSMTSSSPSSSENHFPVHGADVPSRTHAAPPPLPPTTGSDVTRVGNPSGHVPTADARRPTVTNAQEAESNMTSAPPPIRRRAVDLSDVRSCALVQTQMKTRKASASWR